MESMTTSESISIAAFKNQLDAVIEKVRNGLTILITENGNTLAELSPVMKPINQAESYAPSIRTKEEFEAKMAALDDAYAQGRLSVKDSYLANVEPVDMGPTDSSNLDAEIYR